jgi:2-C-methyl-D-erythritol 4-phosphate cytidylyltransferase
MNTKVVAIIAAGGSGVRMNTGIPKQFLILQNKPIIIHTLEKFAGCSEIKQINLVVPQAEIATTTQLIKKWDFTKPIEVIAGGKTRQHSVWQGLSQLPDNTDIVMVHDGVRPFISKKIINECIEETRNWGAVITALPVSDTIKEVTDNRVHTTLDRSKLWRVQTPQSFLRDLLIEAYQKAWESNIIATDDSTLVEKLGHTVRVIKGDEKNIKITSPEDLKIAEKFM